MVGVTLALALAGTGVRIAVLEAISPRANDQPSYDDRGLALSLSSQQILAGLNLWEAVRSTACPVEHIHVSDQHHFGFVRLHSHDLQLPALGHIVLARELGQVLMQKLQAASHIRFICPAKVETTVIRADHAEITVQHDGSTKKLTAKLLVAADGAWSQLRERLGINITHKDYGQTAIVTNVTPGKPHANTAYERFTTQGPLALLPLPDNRCVVVFTVNTEAADRYMSMSDSDFLASLQIRFGRRLGRFQRPGTRKSYPIQLIAAKEQVRDRVVILGNAAHTVHPNGAQGFNLCLRDIAGLAEILVRAISKGEDFGSRHLLNQYQSLRSADQNRVLEFTDTLASMFYNDLPHRVFVRNAGMTLLEFCKPLKQSFARRAMGLYGRQPGLVRGIPLWQ